MTARRGRVVVDRKGEAEHGGEARGMRAAWWWIDRWRKSTAFTDMTAEEQGLYRNLLDEIWLRADHVIPEDGRILAKVSGDPEAWARSGPKVLRWMTKVPGGYTHDTALAVIHQAERLARNQRAYRARKRAQAGGSDNSPADNAPDNEGDNAPDNEGGNKAASPSPSPSPSPSQSQSRSGHRAAKTRREPDDKAARAAEIECLVSEMQTAAGEIGVRTEQYRHIALSLPSADVQQLLSELKESLASPDGARNPGAILFANAKEKAAARGVSLFGPTRRGDGGAVQ